MTNINSNFNIIEWILLFHGIYDFAMDICGIVFPFLHTIPSLIHVIALNVFSFF